MPSIQTNDTHSKILPIKTLNACIHSWTIKVRIISKRNLRSITNSKGVGHVFSFDVIDQENSEIHNDMFQYPNTIVPSFHPNWQSIHNL